MSHRKTWITMGFLLLPLLLLPIATLQAEENGYEVVVNFGGLFAFVQEPASGVVWVLLPDLDFEHGTANLNDLPPGARLEDLMEYHPHYSAIRVFGAKSISFGGSSVGNGEPIPIAGFELSSGPIASTGAVDLGQLADLRKIEKHRTNGANARIPKEARKVNRHYLDDPVGSISTPHLSTRIKISGGALTAIPTSCIPVEDTLGTKPAQYLFKEPGQANCASTQSATPLAELVQWTFRSSGDLVFSLSKAGAPAQLSIAPLCDPKCHPLTVEIVNSTDGKDLKPGPSLETREACEASHLRSFEAYYWFTEKPPFYWYQGLKPTAPYYSPCPAADFTAGDTKCPMIELEP